MVLKENKKEKNSRKKTTPTDTSPVNDAVEPDPGAETAKEPPSGLEAMQEELTTEKERVLRLAAEFENYKKRMQREIADFKKFANETVFKQLLSVVDNLERAIASAEQNGDDAGLLEGVKLTHKEILRLFETFSVRPVEAVNQPFDPNFHQAVTQEENNDLPDNTVTTELQKGYTLHDRLIRPAMVVVSKRVKKEEETAKN